MKNILLLAGLFCSLASFPSLADEQQCSVAAINTLTYGVKSFDRIQAVCKPMPADPSKVLASAIIHDDEVPYSETDGTFYIWRVMLLDSKSFKPLASFQDDIGEDATTRVNSNAIWLDTAPYQLADNNRAFGVRLAIGHDPSCSEGGWDNYLTLFSGDIHNGKLTPILSSIPMSYWALREGYTCDYNNLSHRNVIERATGSIQVLPSSHHGLHDLKMVYHSHEEIYDAGIHEGKKHLYKSLLQFDGKTYPFEWDTLPSKDWWQDK